MTTIETILDSHGIETIRLDSRIYAIDVYTTPAAVAEFTLVDVTDWTPVAAYAWIGY